MLGGYLTEGWEEYETEPEEIGEALATLHLELCDDLRPDPVALGRRLAQLVAASDVGSCPDAPGCYVGLLGEDGLAAFDAA